MDDGSGTAGRPHRAATAQVVALDMAEARTGYRVLSFMGLGLLLLGTSVAYGKRSPKLLRSHAA